jgi:AcrR family transcriptional regulator
MRVAPKKKRGRPRDDALRERRRDEILDAAARLFAEYGYADADIQVLADKLGVGKGTVYRYFPSKEALFLAAVDRALARMTQAIDAASLHVEDPFGRMDAAVRAGLGFLDDNPELVELIIQERAVFKDRKKPTFFVYRDECIGPWRDLLGDLIAAGRVRDVPVDRMLDVMGSIFDGVMFRHYLGERRGSLVSRADDILDLIFHGILTPAERKRRRAD